MNHVKHCHSAVSMRRALVVTSAAVAALALSACTMSGPAPTVEVESLPVDARSQYYGQFKNPLPDDASFFPLAVWHESLTDPFLAEKDKSFGINTYVELTPDSVPQMARDAGMYVLGSTPDGALNGFVLPDEVDMWGKSGHGVWTGAWPGEAPICEPEESRCGYTVMEKSLLKSPEGLVVYANFGKGVTFWEPDTVGTYFVNEYADIVSADNYWFTDPNICSKYEGGTKLDEPRDLTPSECRLAANYGWTVERMRGFVQPAGAKPVWGLVELGMPFAETTQPIKPEEIRAAVWHSIIAGARGIVYFNHSFAGSCASQHVLRDCGEELSGSVTKINQEVRGMANVINAPLVKDSMLSVHGTIRSTVRKLDDAMVVIAGSARLGAQEAEFRLACEITGEIEVVGEDRTVKAQGNVFSDRFEDGNAVHIYRIPTGSC
ncbi:hypothetical protein ACFY5D_15920 [Paeniglutamicibacter sp. NPDC012692]|uniref:hypothetical protein n=1 Tax=Paeniglutamicibacter sp. NPDC012692 TaxID=3364388 RepID=UPI0036AB7C46